MAITGVQIKDFLVFKGNLAIDFSHGINILIGGNGTGKTTLMKYLYWWICNQSYLDWETNSQHRRYFTGIEHYFGGLSVDKSVFTNPPKVLTNSQETVGVYIPEKDILEHSKGLLTFIEQKETGFGAIYRDVLLKAQDIPTRNQSQTQQIILSKISKIINGEVKWDKGDGSFYTIKTNGDRIPFANEASGFKKLGFLGLLVTCGQLEKGSTLLWDEPENSLNPELVPALVEILLELAKNGIQVFIATHDYNLARYFDIRYDKTVKVQYHNLIKDNDQIICNSSPEYLKIHNNLLEAASSDLFKAVVSDSMRRSEDE
jgi:energy-coupling factor transporter ATP-binding protein EcfA2